MEKGKEIEWAKKLFDIEKSGETAIYFAISLLTCVGALPWPLYVGYGLAALPWELIKGSKSLAESRIELGLDLERIRDKFKGIQDKYSKSHTKISKNDQKMLNFLKKKERVLSEKTEKISEKEKNQSIFHGLVKILTPFRVFIGIIFLIVSVIIFVSITMSTFDKLVNSKCGLKCAFFLDKQSFINPIDYLLIKSNNYNYIPALPLDFLIFFCLSFYFFLAALYGIVRLGIRLAFFTVL